MAVGSRKSIIDDYYDVVDSQLIKLSINISFLEYLDIIFKLNFIFNTKHVPNLELLWNYIQHFVFNISEMAHTKYNLYL